MAFKAIDLSEKKPYISSADPAIDHINSDVAGYKATLDEALLKFLPDMEPTIFEIGVISDRDYSRIQDDYMTIDVEVSKGDKKPGMKIAPTGMAREFVRVGLKGVKNADNFTLKFNGGAHPQKVSERSMDQLRAWGVVEEIGNLIMDVNKIDDEDEKKPGPQ